MKKVLMLMLALVAGTVWFTNSSTLTSSVAQTRFVMMPQHKNKLSIQPLLTKGQLAIRYISGQVVYSQNVALSIGLSQQFDISSLGIRGYQLTLTTGIVTLTKSIVVQANPNEIFFVQ